MILASQVCVSGWMLVHKEGRQKEKEHKTQLTV